MSEQETGNINVNTKSGKTTGRFMSHGKVYLFVLLAAFLSLVPLTGFSLIAIVATLYSVAFVVAAIAVKGNYLPLLAYLPYAVISVVRSDYAALLLSFLTVTLSLILFITLSKSGRKSVSVISGAAVITIFSLIALCLILYSRYDSVSADAFSEMKTDISASLEQYIDSNIETLEQAQLLDIDKEALLASVSELISAFLYISPGFLIFISLWFSYFISLILYSFLSKDGFRYKPSLSELTVSMPGAGVFTAATVLFSMSMIFGGSVVGIIALNFMIIYSPLFFVIGIRYYVRTAIKTKKIMMLIILGALFLFYPIFPIMLILFGGIRSTVANYIASKSKMNPG